MKKVVENRRRSGKGVSTRALLARNSIYYRRVRARIGNIAAHVRECKFMSKQMRHYRQMTRCNAQRVVKMRNGLPRARFSWKRALSSTTAAFLIRDLPSESRGPRNVTSHCKRRDRVPLPLHFPSLIPSVRADYVPDT